MYRAIFGVIVPSRCIRLWNYLWTLRTQNSSIKVLLCQVFYLYLHYNKKPSLKTTNTMQNYRELTENYLETRSERDFTVLYKKVKPGLKSYIYKIVKDSEATEDILVNTLAKMWTKIDQFDPQYQITTWLYKIAFNECLGFISDRNKKTSLNKLSEYGIEIESSGSLLDGLDSLVESAEMKTEQDFIDEDNAIQNQYLDCLSEIQSLKPLYKDIVADRLLNNMKYEDISAKYDLPLQTIKNRILRVKRIIVDNIENSSK